MGRGRRGVVGAAIALGLGLAAPAWAADEPTQGDDSIEGHPNGT
ncbi:hypothetical protein [Nocardioides antri]|nr:hypothetical protein [Nocardioides antri]